MRITDGKQSERVKVTRFGRRRGSITFAGLERCGFLPSLHQVETRKLGVSAPMLASLRSDPDWA